MANGWGVLFGVLGLQFVFILFFVLYQIRYNIPVAVLRYTGNKDRPTLIVSKAKKTINNGVPRLYIRGYKEPIRDYLSENYYPSPRGKYGGLLLWEFEDGLLTPVLPNKEYRKLSEEEKKEYNEALSKVQKLTKVNFRFDENLYHDLRLKAVDDVDTEFALQEMVRVDGQYSGGWKDFLMKYGGHIAIIVIAVLFLVGLIQWFEKMPDFAAQCYGAASRSVEQSLIERAAEAATPAG